MLTNNQYLKQLKPKKLFNPKGNNDASEQKIINGNPTNIFNFSTVKYKWATVLYKTLKNNDWEPDKIPIMDDKVSYESLSDVERETFNKILSYLVSLDSIQESNIPIINLYMSCPEINHLLVKQTHQESYHIDSYKYIIESVIPEELRPDIYEYWRKCPALRKRNSLITNALETFNNTPTEENLKKALLYTYILEGLFFWMGFNFFYLLESQNKMKRTALQIEYINRDEDTHCAIFSTLIRTLHKEGTLVFSEELVHSVFEQAVQEEIEWNNYLFSDSQVLGFDLESIESYIKYLANYRIKVLLFNPLYSVEKYSDNPFEYLTTRSFKKQGAIKANFFESNVLEYVHSNCYTEKEWDEIDNLELNGL